MIVLKNVHITNLHLINRSWRFNAQRSEYKEQHRILITKLAKNLHLNDSNHKKEMIIM